MNPFIMKNWHKIGATSIKCFIKKYTLYHQFICSLTKPNQKYIPMFTH